MRFILKKFTKIYTGVLIFSAIACAIVGAQSICCNEDPYSCDQPAKMGSRGDVAAIILSGALSHSLGDQLQPRNCSNEKILKVASGNDCCEIDCCEKSKNDSYVQPTLVQVDNSFQLTEPFSILKKGINKKFEANNHPRSALSVPIYILTLSIIC